MDEKTKSKMMLVGTILALLVCMVVIVLGVTRKPKTPSDIQEKVSNNEQVTNGKLQIEDLVIGVGAEAVSGKKITVNYSGTLTNGTKFDSSYDRNQPFSFTLGSGQVIAGWDQGFAGMKVGGKRKLTIPPELGYGDKTAGTIPPNSTLVFEVELLEVN